MQIREFLERLRRFIPSVGRPKSEDRETNNSEQKTRIEHKFARKLSASRYLMAWEIVDRLDPGLRELVLHHIQMSDDEFDHFRHRIFIASRKLLESGHIRKTKSLIDLQAGEVARNLIRVEYARAQTADIVPEG